MKATDLRIGNLIDRNGSQVWVGWGTLKAISEGIDVGHFIPLTEEMVQRFGFNKNGDEFQSTNWSGLYLKFNSQWYMRRHAFGNKDIDICYGFKYVHEFQNLWFALTKEELILK